MSDLVRSDATAHKRPIVLTEESDDDEEVAIQARKAIVIADSDSETEVAGGNTSAPASPKAFKKGKGYCFTWHVRVPFADGAAAEDHIKALWRVNLKDKCRYFVCQLEECPTTKKQHFQGYVYVDGQFRINTVKSWIQGAHWEIAKGSPEQNKEYCTKSKSQVAGPWEFGEFPRAGKRNDLVKLYEITKETKSVKTALEAMPAPTIRYFRAVEKIAAMYQDKRDWAMDVRIFIGAPGAGKSREARELCKREGVDWYTKANHKWWDGYVGQHTVIWDDFDGTAMTIQFALQLLDRYDLGIEVKGDIVQFRSKRIIFTTNLKVEDWWPTAQGIHMDAIKRRITEIKEF